MLVVVVMMATRGRERCHARGGVGDDENGSS